MSLLEKIGRFSRKPIPAKWTTIKSKLRTVTSKRRHASERTNLSEFIIGSHAPPKVLEGSERIYIAYRPDSEYDFKRYPEIAQLSQAWIKGNIPNNAGDLPRLYALILNVKQVLEEGVQGDVAELGVYRGNSAAVLAHYARRYSRKIWLFDTFKGFDDRDFVGDDSARTIEFSETSLEYVRKFVGESNARFVEGRFPQSIPAEAYGLQFCVVHIDCDLHEPARAALEFFYPRLLPGGVLIVHDYANPYWSGIKQAVDEFCTSIPERLLVFGDKSGTAMIRKSALS